MVGSINLWRRCTSLLPCGERGSSEVCKGQRPTLRVRSRCSRRSISSIWTSGNTCPPVACLTCGSGRKPAGRRSLSRISSGVLRQGFPWSRPPERHPHPLLHCLPAARHHHARHRPVGEIIALFEQRPLPLHHLRLLRLVIFLHRRERLRRQGAVGEVRRQWIRDSEANRPQAERDGQSDFQLFIIPLPGNPRRDGKPSHSG
jgi:hypothetical protein